MAPMLKVNTGMKFCILVWATVSGDNGNVACVMFNLGCQLD